MNWSIWQNVPRQRKSLLNDLYVWDRETSGPFFLSKNTIYVCFMFVASINMFGLLAYKCFFINQSKRIEKIVNKSVFNGEKIGSQTPYTYRREKYPRNYREATKSQQKIGGACYRKDHRGVGWNMEQDQNPGRYSW